MLPSSNLKCLSLKTYDLRQKEPPPKKLNFSFEIIPFFFFCQGFFELFVRHSRTRKGPPALNFFRLSVTPFLVVVRKGVFQVFASIVSLLSAQGATTELSIRRDDRLQKVPRQSSRKKRAEGRTPLRGLIRRKRFKSLKEYRRVFMRAGPGLSHLKDKGRAKTPCLESFLFFSGMVFQINTLAQALEMA